MLQQESLYTMKLSLIDVDRFSQLIVVVLFAAIATIDAQSAKEVETRVLWEILDYVHQQISDEGNAYGSA